MNLTIQNKWKIVIIIILGFILTITLIPVFLSFRTAILRGSYSISWSGTTAQGYRVDDHASGNFEIQSTYFLGSTSITFSHTTTDPDDMSITLTFDVSDPIKPKLISYEINTDYSSVKESGISIALPVTLSGSGRGSYDWRDSWSLSIDSLTL